MKIQSVYIQKLHWKVQDYNWGRKKCVIINILSKNLVILVLKYFLHSKWKFVLQYRRKNIRSRKKYLKLTLKLFFKKKMFRASTKRKDYLQTFCEQKEGPVKLSTAELISYLSPLCSDYFLLHFWKCFFLLKYNIRAKIN